MRYPFKHRCHTGLVLLLLVLMAGSLEAQEGKKNYAITGAVTDARTGEPLIGANVIIEATTIGAATNAEGKFSILARVEPGVYKITYRFIGYKKQTQDLRLADTETTDMGQVGLAQDLLQIDEIVVTGTAIATEKERLGNTIATVRGNAIAEANAPTLDAALTGKVAGAMVQQNSGTPGGGTTVRLRGTSTISSSAEPLYIVDGVIVDNSSNELVNLGGYVGNRIADIEANDIDHIEVVKGAAAAALYGSRANNGVIQIFTKRGTAGDTRITYRSRVGTSKIRKTYEVNLFGFDKPPLDATRRAVTRRDYQEDIFRTGYDVENYLSISGGSDRTRYYLSGSHENEEGIMEATDYRKINFRVNLDQTVSKWLQLSVSANYINSHSNRVPNGGIVGGEGVITNFAFQPNWFDLRANAEGRFPTSTLPNPGFANELEVLATWENPLKVNRFIGGLHATATPLKNLSLDYTLGYDQYTEKAERRIPRGSSAGYTTGFSQSAIQDVLLVNNDITAAHVTSKFGLEFTTTIGMNHQYYEGSNVTASVRDLIPVAELLSAGAVATAFEFNEKRVIYGYFGQETIGYRSKLFLTGALRIDGASTFSKNDRWQTFPKASLSYLLSAEPWWQNSLGGVFNRFKLRTAWGTSGGQPAGSYDVFSVYVQQSNSNRPGLVNSTLLGNENLKPERMREFEIGTDFGMFDDRLSFEFSYYDKRVEDLLLRRTLPPSTGFVGIRDNVGVLSNKGYEVLGKALIFNANNFQWLTTVTVSHNKNKVLQLNSPAFSDPNSFGIARVAEGEPLGFFFGPTYLRDSTGAMVLNNGIPVRNPANRKIGDPNPELTVSLSNDFRLGRLSLHTQVDGVFGNDVFNFTRRILETPAFGNGKEYERELSGELPTGYFVVRRSIFEEYIEDGSFIKLREVTLNYLLDTGFVSNLGLKSLQLSLSGRNLFSIDDYSGYDPEVNVASQSTLVRGFDWSTIPLPRTFSFGITANY